MLSGSGKSRVNSSFYPYKDSLGEGWLPDFIFKKKGEGKNTYTELAASFFLFFCKKN